MGWGSSEEFYRVWSREDTMRTRLYSQGRNAMSERWFVRSYAVPVFNQGAVLRWIQSNNAVSNLSGQHAFRIHKVKTIMQMEDARWPKNLLDNVR